MNTKYVIPLTVLLTSVNASMAETSSSHSAYRGYAYPLDLVAAGPCVPADINDSGEVVGVNYRNPYNILGFVTGPNGVGSTPLSLGGRDSNASAINSAGQVVGTSETDDTGLVISAYITDAGGKNIRPIGPLGGTASAINDRGQVAGQVNGIAYLTGPNGKSPQFIPSLGSFTSIAAVNFSGQLTGQFSDQVSIYHAFVTGANGLGMVDLNIPGSTSSAGIDINDRGEVTGEQWIGEPGHREQYVASHDNPDARLLGTLDNRPGGRSEGGGINNKGILVGVSSKGDKYGRIYVTITGPDGVMRNLNRYVEKLPPGVYLTGSPVINNRNQIAARASDGLCYLVCPDANCQGSNPPKTKRD
jgi:probable HAF family extracellular repeat protein